MSTKNHHTKSHSVVRHSVHAWDRTTRWFHWINVLCVLALIFISHLLVTPLPIG